MINKGNHTQKFCLSDFLYNRRSQIIHEWVKRLKTEVGEQYAKRPVEELFGTVSEAFDANYQMIVYDDYTHIHSFINKITKMRLESGFLLSQVQMAFELFRNIVIPLLVKETTIDSFYESILKINQCLTYTIHRFSDLFQSMHEKAILDHNQKLEEQVISRTAQLQESERKYKTLVEEINDGYFVIQDEIIVFVNNAFCRMHGYHKDEVIGKKFYEFVCPESRPKVIDIYTEGLKKGRKTRTFEYQRLTKDGQCFPTEILAKNTRYENKISSIGICRDITQRVKMEQRIRESERMAYIGQITMSLSHEIRNPLSAVKMNLQILQKNEQILGNDRRRIDISIREVNRLEQILLELLDFAKPIQIKFQPHQINDILSSSIELLEIKIKEAALTVKADLYQNLPEMLLDSEKIEQAFINLLLNAIEASPKGGTIHITTGYYKKDRSMIEITIADEGKGISDKNLPNIFQPFFTTKSRGTGLGLGIVKRIVEAHHGSIEADNLNSGGAVFRMRLPIR